MSLFEATWTFSLTLLLLAFPFPINAVLTGFLNSTGLLYPSASVFPVSNTLVSAKGTNFMLNATDAMLSSIDEEISVAEACPSVVAAMAATAVPFVECDTFLTSYCYTYTTYNFPESVYPPVSCCDTCTIQASRVQVNYWAPETDSAATTQAPETPYTLVSDGFTFTSPSVYVVYKDLYALVDCTGYNGRQIGNNISDTTIAYDPDALSTAECYQPDNFNKGFMGYQPINYASWYNPPPNSVVETQAGCDLVLTNSINPAGTDLVASPMFMMPEGLSSLEPVWSSYNCQANGRNPAFDPPRVLTKTSALVPGVHPASQFATATPAAQPSPPIVTPTTASHAHPTLGGGTPNPKTIGVDPDAGGFVRGSAIPDQRPTPTSLDAESPEDDPGAIAIGANLQTAKTLASVEVAGQPLLNSDPTNQGLGPGLSQNIGEDPPNTQPGTVNPVITVGSEAYQYHIDAASNLVIASKTAYAGGPAIYVSSVRIALLSSANSIVVDGTRVPIARPEPTPDRGFTVGNELVYPNSASEYVVSGQTITPGAPAVTISGTPISLGPLAMHVVIGSSTIPLETPESSELPSFTFGKEVITADSTSRYVVDGQTLVPGAPAITVSGTPISLARSGAHIALGSTTIPLQEENVPFPSTIVVNGEIITANSASQFVVGGQTITPGAPAVTIQGTPVSVPADVLPFITVGSQEYPYAVDSAGDIVIASQTVVPGGVPITVSGETISEASDRSDLVFASGGVVETEGLAQPIAGALGKTAVSTDDAGGDTSFRGQMFTGGASTKNGINAFGLTVIITLLTAFV